MAFEIENGILKKCTLENGMTKVVIPKEVTAIAPKAFLDCSELTEVELNEGLLEIGEWAFGYTAIETVKFPNSLEKIGEKAMEHIIKRIKEPMWNETYKWDIKIQERDSVKNYK